MYYKLMVVFKLYEEKNDSISSLQQFRRTTEI